MEKLTVKKMIENAEAIAMASINEIVLKSFYVYTDAEVYNNLNLVDAIITYIENRKSGGYIAIGINYSLASDKKSLAMDLINNKLGFTYICKDYEKMNYDVEVCNAFNKISNTILLSYGDALQSVDAEDYRTHINKLNDQKIKESDADAERKRIDNLPYVTIGKFTKCKIIMQIKESDLIMNDDALVSSDRNLKKYGYMARSGCDFIPLGSSQDQAKKRFLEITK